MTARIGLSLAGLVVSHSLAAKQHFVATDGNDGNTGDKSSPFATIGKCMDVSQPGDFCYMRAGVYRQENATFAADSDSGKKSAEPITIAAYKDEKVVWSGLQRLDMHWKKVSGTECTYKAKVDRPVWQLFVGEEMQTSARWPNTHWKDMSVFNSSKVYAEGDLSASTCGHTKKIESLAAYTQKTGMNVSGAIAVMNIGSWINYALPVVQPAADELTYECPNPGKRDSTRFFLEGKPEFVDSATEWSYDPATGEILFWAEGCADPNDLEVFGKVQSYFVQGSQSYLTLRNIEFFALTFDLTSSKGLTIDSCTFKYPVYSRRMLGETGVDVSLWHHGQDLKFINNTVAYTDGQFLEQGRSQNSTFENNYFHHLDYSCSGAESGGNHAVINLNKWDVFRWNTMHDIGPSKAVNVEEGGLVEYNLIHDLYTLQNDGSLVQMGSANPAATCRFNWAYNTEKRSYRYDRVNTPDPKKSAAHGVLYGNLAWNTSATFVKGDMHNVSANVQWMPVTKGVPDISGSSMALIVLGPGETPYAFDWENTHTTVERNGASQMGCGKKNHSWAGPASNNVEAKVEAQLVDVAGRDFRPKPGSKFDKAGVGPYSADGSDYWIPGQHLHGASHPVPADGAEGVEPGSASRLFFRPGFRAEDHEVQLAEEGGALLAQPRLGASHGVAPTLRPQTVYQWRVVTRHADHEVAGPVWTFRTGGVETIVV